MLMLDGNFNPLAILNKQGHIINGNIPLAPGTFVTVLYVFLSHK